MRVVLVQLHRLFQADADVHAVRLDPQRLDLADVHAAHEDVVPLAQPLDVLEHHFELVASG